MIFYVYFSFRPLLFIFYRTVWPTRRQTMCLPYNRKYHPNKKCDCAERRNYTFDLTLRNSVDEMFQLSDSFVDYYSSVSFSNKI